MNLGTLRPVEAVLAASMRPRAAAAVSIDDEISAVRRNVVTLRPTSRGKIIGQHPTIRKVLETIDRIASSMCTVLVTGESGTGKELVVAALHDASQRRTGPLVTINCGAIPAELVESELFGHVKGAFTGAQNTRRGHVASAEGGTLFLDEVGELPMAAQVKLLRVLQQREYTPVGESRSVKCDVRVVAATNRDLKAEVAAGRFREDLYYRLNVIHLSLPALRERGTDVRVLATHFYRSSIISSGRTDLRGFSAAALNAMEVHNWPGNVRALENSVERAVLLARGPFIEPEDILGGSMRVAIEAPLSGSRPDPRREPPPSVRQPEPRREVLETRQPEARREPEPRREAELRREAEVRLDQAGRREMELRHDAEMRRELEPRREAEPRRGVETRREPELITPDSPRPVNRSAQHPTAGNPSASGDATALPPPPKAARFDSIPRSERLQTPPVVSFTTAAERRGSNPGFPRVLPEQGFDLFSAVETYQNHLIRQALARTGGNKNKAAQLLGLNRTTLVEMIRRRGL